MDFQLPEKPQGLIDLERRKIELQVELGDIEGRINEHNSRLSPSRPTVSPTQAEALALLDGREGNNIAESEVRRQIEELRHRRNVLRAALEEIEKRIRVAYDQYCRDCCAAIKPAYMKIAKRYVAALKQFCDAMEEDRRFRDALRQAGVERLGGLPPIGLPNVSDWSWQDNIGVGPIYGWKKFVQENYPDLL
ncbi:MAG TPA: hypothetical protein VNM15_04915 [Candidatus Binatia bacterium]|nr:hypothetical protein [Candidatus Binatia bacterium]